MAKNVMSRVVKVIGYSVVCAMYVVVITDYRKRALEAAKKVAKQFEK